SVGGERADCFMPERLNALDPAPPRGYMVTVHEITDDGIVQVDAFFHPHGNLDNLGYCFTTPDKIIVWTGDGRLTGGEYRNTWVSRTC
ncbi:MAG: hypothetical protein QNK19_18225, partial [Xanthomonadales bacterium]|nr:hypothetical protein [Xanthomonadales bacterium]